MALPDFAYDDIGPLKRVECENVPDLMVLAGPNGVGKSTLLDSIARDYQDHFATSRLVESGELESVFEDADISKSEIEEIKKAFEEEESLPDDTNVAFVGPHRGMSNNIPIRERDLIGMPTYSTKFLYSLSRLSRSATQYWLNKGQGNFRSNIFDAEKGMLDELPYYEVRRRLAQIHSNIEKHITSEFFEGDGEVDDPDLLEWLSPLQEAIEEVLPGIELKEIEKTDDHEYEMKFENNDGTVVKFHDLSSGKKMLSRYFSLLGRGLLVSSQQELEVTAGKGDATASPDERCSLSRRSSRSVAPRTCWNRFAGATASIARAAVANL
ncbi:ATP-binding protein, partial [Halorubrum sp. GN11_10-6_MGM]